jgi:signal transduction histidine kinase
MSAIQSAAAHLAKLIDDILDVAAIDAGQLELELGDVDLGDVAREAADLVSARAEHHQIRLEVEVAGDIGLLRADRNRLKQVSMNLLSNAIRHVQTGGHVTIGARRADDELTLWVADDGEGIAPEKQATVFDRFARGERGGAGLGLALVKEIAQLHGGWVELQSEPEKGTTVSCHLPCEPHGAAVPPELDLAKRPAAGRA